MCMASAKRTNKTFSIQIYHQLCVLFRMVLVSRILFHPVPPTALDKESTDSDASSVEADNDVCDHDASASYSAIPKLMSQSNLDNLVRNLDLPKGSAELLGSRLHKRNFLAPGTTFLWYRHREKEFLEFFSMKDSLVFCNNIEGLVNQMRKKYDPAEWETVYRFIEP